MERKQSLTKCKPVKAKTPLTVISMMCEYFHAFFIAFLLIWHWVAKEQILEISRPPYEVGRN
jgi:hypothetical protein